MELNRIQTTQPESQNEEVDSGESQKVDISETAETSGGQPLARKSGDGARKKFSDYRESMMRTYQSTSHEIETTLYARDESDSTINSSSVKLPERAYTRLWSYHSGWHSDDTGRREEKDQIAMTQALADELPITNYEKQRALDIIQNIKKKQFNRNGGTIAAILGTLAYVREESLSEGRVHTTDPDQLMELRIMRSDSYQELCSQYDVDYHDALKQVKKAVR